MDFFAMTSTTLALTDEALDMINFFAQLLTVSVALVLGLLTVMVLLLIFSS